MLEAALKQMHVAFTCALLHDNMNHLPFTSVFFCWPHPPAAFLLRVLASCVLVLVPASTGALALAFGPTCVDLGLAHRTAL
jgi:hypothetical protein